MDFQIWNAWVKSCRLEFRELLKQRCPEFGLELYELADFESGCGDLCLRALIGSPAGAFIGVAWVQTSLWSFMCSSDLYAIIQPWENLVVPMGISLNLKQDNRGIAVLNVAQSRGVTTRYLEQRIGEGFYALIKLLEVNALRPRFTGRVDFSPMLPPLDCQIRDWLREKWGLRADQYLKATAALKFSSLLWDDQRKELENAAVAVP